MNTVPSTNRQKTDDFLRSYALKRFCYSLKRLETFKVWNLQIKGTKHATYVTWNFSHESNYREWHRSNWYEISWTDNPSGQFPPRVIPPTLFHLPLRNLPTIHVEFMWVGIFRGGGNCPSGNNCPGAFSEP